MPVIKKITSEAIIGKSVWVGNCDDEVFSGSCDFQAVALAAATWNDLETDSYLKDNGRYRKRRYAELVYDATLDELTDLKRTSFYQSTAYNQVNGGTRTFMLIDDGLLLSPLLQRILKHFSRRFSTALGARRLELFLHQVRILGEPGITGLPTPEGIHKDGVDFSCQILFGRKNLTGGESIIYDNEKQALVATTMLEPLDFYCFRDPDIYHSVTPVSSLDGVSTGTRDILGVEFCVQREREAQK
ncbi:2OG-Fe dioxygenase family protein [Achromobacter xylosoxidans]|uniref:2OG-Fe dioxygenase family protein n=1 Tax=Alcaligenes xylosoxydans xylosoxydans TaxID=85698 RepID=UPI000B4938A1|nr:2OG-Fe dioxygenase family protein [Achromobacter xylosoxidans]